MTQYLRVSSVFQRGHPIQHLAKLRDETLEVGVIITSLITLFREVTKQLQSAVSDVKC